MEILNSETKQPVHFFYAGFWLRFAALVLDSILITVINVLFILMFFGIHAFKIYPLILSPFSFRVMTNFSAAGIIIVIKWLYFAGFESSQIQSTPGKAAVGIRVTDLYGKRISFAKATIRFFGKIISRMILYIGYIMAGFTEKKQALHDLLAKTLVIRD